MRRFFVPWLLVAIVVFLGKAAGEHFGVFTGGALLGYDKILHFLGGVACGIFGVWFAIEGPFDPLRSLRSHNALLMQTALASAIVIGAAWEVLEYVVPSMQDPRGWDFVDTSLDMIFDMLGAAFAAWAYQEKDRNNSAK